ncbi:hypothetical protein EN943_07445 [Mesorhizobium sp. M7A.F.Ca.US.006.01.1.1]|uniref:DUF5681 domain-containing protein n=1 Tax=Mesorhizobium sp. M7A.F.Ca.US.006.01.1.1 TaxID=2496707 RepID=UPI000FCA1A30|nr:DUF5681 domain-containing protein [Mesorhizobium sp. M7A.F.Ca.US.006.01.1.1]RUZ79400.1 hypothetical protein EN943_07445 [Mesorhizobium sp. M7A.F.Ca.US.006.01.1.1]
MSRDDEDDKVGYGKPPKKSRFKPGQSGNPRGRRKRTENIGLAILAELGRPITVRENGKEQILTKRDAIAKTIVSRAMDKDVRMIQLLISLVPDQFRIPDNAKLGPSPDVSSEEAAILERFVARRLGSVATDQSRGEQAGPHAGPTGAEDKRDNND